MAGGGGSSGRRACGMAASLVVAIACLATLLFALSTIVSRPLDGSEGNFLFDASRIREKLALYVDPRLGAWDYGSTPSRYYVLYAPMWAAVLAVVPGAFAPTCARALSLAAWLALLGGSVVTAPRPRRHAAALAALFVAGLYPLTLFAASGRPDAVAVALTGAAVLRSVRRERVGALEGALFALAPFLKPNVFAAGLGAIAADVAARRGKAWPALVAAASTAAVCAGALQALSGGVWVEHLVKATWMPMSASLWGEQMATRGPFFALPLAVCAWCGVRARAPLALSALGASVAWTLWSLAKIGSASNYWMEPCAVGLALVATFPLPPLPAALRAIAGPAALAQALWTGVAAVRSSAEAMAASPRKRAALASVRDACGAGARDVVMADEPGLEVMLDGRLLEQPLVLTQLVRQGAFPEAIWLADVARPEVRCLVVQSGTLEGPASADDPDHDLFSPNVRRALRARFELAAARDGVWIYRLR
jgi:hypothetical protein